METINFINSISNNSFDDIRAELYRLFIKSGYDDNNRLILYPGARGANIVGKINDECNGLILELDEKNNAKLLSLPMPYIRNSNQINEETIIRSWNDDCKIYKCRQSTNITLYYFDGKWVISTCKGIDVNDTIWNSNLTYKDAVEECLVQYGMSWKSFTSSLNVEYSYALGFTHPDYHIFNNPEHDIWINKVTSVNDCNNVTVVNIGLEFIKEEDFSNMNVNEIYKAISFEHDNSFESFTSSNKINLGYIVRNLNGGDVLFESELQTLINKLYYNSEYTKAIFQTS